MSCTLSGLGSLFQLRDQVKTHCLRYRVRRSGSLSKVHAKFIILVFGSDQGPDSSFQEHAQIRSHYFRKRIRLGLIILAQEVGQGCRPTLYLCVQNQLVLFCVRHIVVLKNEVYPTGFQNVYFSFRFGGLNPSLCVLKYYNSRAQLLFPAQFRRACKISQMEKELYKGKHNIHINIQCVSFRKEHYNSLLQGVNQPLYCTVTQALCFRV